MADTSKKKKHTATDILVTNKDGFSYLQADEKELPRDFWQRHFMLQALAAKADMAGGQFSVEITDQRTGKTTKLKGVRFVPQSDKVN